MANGEPPHVANRGRDFVGRSLADAAGIFCKGHVQDGMLAVFDRPVAADVLGEGADLGGVAADEPQCP
jgi:hypothetical protein